MLYNIYTALIDYPDYNIWTNGSFAVRNEQFKLMHTYNDEVYSQWDDPLSSSNSNSENTFNNNDLSGDSECAQQFVSGDYVVGI